MPQISHTRSIALMCGSVLLFAVNVLLLRWLTLQSPQIDGWAATFYRGIVGCVLVFSLYWKTLNFKGIFKQPILMLRGLLGSVGITALYLTIDHMTVGRATLLNLTYPLFATVIAAVVLKERPTKSVVIWMIVAFLGLVIFLFPGIEAQGVSLWDGVALFGAFVAGIVVVMIRFLNRSETTPTIYASQCLWSAVIATPLAAKEAIALPPMICVWLIIAAVIVTIAQLMMTQAYRQLTTSSGSAIQMILPLVVASGGFVIFQESFNLSELLGACLVLFATWRVVISK